MTYKIFNLTELKVLLIKASTKHNPLPNNHKDHNNNKIKKCNNKINDKEEEMIKNSDKLYDR